MTANGDTPAPSVWEQIGLPAHFTPGRVDWKFVKITTATPAGPRTVHAVIVDTIAGRFAFVLDGPDLARMCRQGLEETSGLTIATESPPPPRWPLSGG